MVLYHATCQDCDEFDAEFELHGQRDLMADQHEHEFGHEVEREPESPEYEIVTDGGTSNVAVSRVLEIVEEVESEVVAEDKLGATRDMVAEGTCKRISHRIRDEAGVNHG